MGKASACTYQVRPDRGEEEEMGKCMVTIGSTAATSAIAIIAATLLLR